MLPLLYLLAVGALGSPEGAQAASNVAQLGLLALLTFFGRLNQEV